MPRDGTGERTVRLATRALLAMMIAFALVELVRFAAAGDGRSVVIGAGAAAIFLPLHAYHLRYGLRGLRPPRSQMTLAVMLVVHAAALVLIGPAWGFMLATLVVSGGIVLRPWWALALLTACCLATLPGHVGVYYTGGHPDIIYGLIVRSGLQIGLVRLVAAAYQLTIARNALSLEAATIERHRLGADVSAAVQARLESISLSAAAARRAHAAVDTARTLLALDRIVRLAEEALRDLRRIVAEVHDPVGAASADARTQAAIADASPVRGALATRRAWLLAALIYVVYIPFSLLNSTGVLGYPPTRYPGVAIAAWLGLVAALIPLALSTAAGRRVRWGPPAVAVAGLLSLGLIPLIGEIWIGAAPLFGAAAALALKGRPRLLCLLIVAAVVLADAAGVSVATGTWIPYPAAGLLSPAALGLWFGGYESFITILGISGLYAAPRLVALVGELESTRAGLARLSAVAERKRLSADVHDLLGQKLTAFALKADLARRLARVDPARAGTEIDALVCLADGNLSELNAVTAGHHTVGFDTELADAVALLQDAGVVVDVDAGLGEIDPEASALLGWAIREGTTNILRHANPTRCTVRATADGGELSLVLVNDGVKDAPDPPGTGLRSLADRVDAANGSLIAQRRDDGCYRLQVRLHAPVRA